MTQFAQPVAASIEVEPQSWSGESRVGDPEAAFRDFLRGRATLTDIDSGSSAVDYVCGTLDDAQKLGIQVTSKGLDKLLREAFGAPEDARERMDGLTDEELNARFGDLLPVLARYIETPGEKRDRLSQSLGDKVIRSL